MVVHKLLSTLQDAVFAPVFLPNWASQVALVVKNPPANAGDIRDAGLILRLGRFPWRRHGNPLQYFCLGNPMDRGTWWGAVHRVSKSWTRLKWLRTHAHTFLTGEGNGNPVQYSRLGNPMDRAAWRATVHGVARVRHDWGTKPPPS